ncbi:unnamed protein product [Miscanthus lutarioriparius]|uniref:Uncharacterized protein n=1 Tax=Miscanthus lutarioriparius TaxID=422564 RepID=A0A811QYG1_9POAL|nr:unnamed protein product [Miscanthus lutarioriparius]
MEVVVDVVLHRTFPPWPSRTSRLLPQSQCRAPSGHPAGLPALGTPLGVLPWASRVGSGPQPTVHHGSWSIVATVRGVAGLGGSSSPGVEGFLEHRVLLLGAVACGADRHSEVISDRGSSLPPPVLPSGFLPFRRKSAGLHLIYSGWLVELPAGGRGGLELGAVAAEVPEAWGGGPQIQAPPDLLAMMARWRWRALRNHQDRFELGRSSGSGRGKHLWRRCGWRRLDRGRCRHGFGGSGVMRGVLRLSVTRSGGSRRSSLWRPRMRSRGRRGRRCSWISRLSSIFVINGGVVSMPTDSSSQSTSSTSSATSVETRVEWGWDGWVGRCRLLRSGGGQLGCGRQRPGGRRRGGCGRGRLGRRRRGCSRSNSFSYFNAVNDDDPCWSSMEPKNKRLRYD